MRDKLSPKSGAITWYESCQDKTATILRFLLGYKTKKWLGCTTCWSLLYGQLVFDWFVSYVVGIMHYQLQWFLLYLEMIDVRNAASVTPLKDWLLSYPVETRWSYWHGNIFSVSLHSRFILKILHDQEIQFLYNNAHAAPHDKKHLNKQWV